MAFNYPIVIPWLVFGGVIIVLTIVLTIVTLLLKDRNEKAKIPVFVTVMGLLAICFCLVLIPVDIFNISQQENPLKHSVIIKWVYYCSYIVLLLFAFVLIPFAYFFFEESDEETTLARRLFHTMKFTIFTIAAGVLIIILALVLKFGASVPTDDKLNWIKSIVDYSHYGDRAIGFMVACLALIGLIVFNIYTAYGLAALPVSLLKRNRQLYVELNDIQEEMDIRRDKMHDINRKYELTGNELNRKDKLEIQKLKRELRELERRNKNLDRVKSAWLTRLEPFIYPLKFIIGILFLLATVIIMISLLITCIDRLIHSKCGIWCGFLTEKSHVFNPFDQLLVYSSIAFPVDYVLLGCFILLIVVGSVVGLSNIGVRFLCINLYKIRYRRTMPQGLLTACIFLMFVIVVFSFTLISFVPQYATFGSQTYISSTTGKHVQCDFSALYNGTFPVVNETITTTTTTTTIFTDDLDVSNDEFLWLTSIGGGGSSSTVSQLSYVGRPCYMSQLGTLVNNVALRVPVFSIIFYFANWVFIACYLLFIVVSCIRRPVIINTEDSDDEDDSFVLDERKRIDPLKSSTSGSSINAESRREANNNRRRDAASARYSTNYDV